MESNVDNPALKKIHKQIELLYHRLRIKEKKIEPDAAGILIALAYPDRVGQIEPNGRIRLRSGKKLSIASEYFEPAEFFSISQLDFKNNKVLLAAPIQRNDLINLFTNQIKVDDEIFWDSKINRIVSKRCSRLGALLLEEVAISDPNPEVIVDIVQKYITDKNLSPLNWNESSNRLKQRMAFLHLLDPTSWPDVSEEALLNTADEWLRPWLYNKISQDELKRINVEQMLINILSYQKQQEMNVMAPEYLEVPSGSKIQIDYTNNEAPVLAVRLQEIFGLLETPKIANGRVTLLIHLLSPARRPVQITKDLSSFWRSGYFEVRKDLRSQYPKHAWPDDPITAEAIRGVKKKNS